MGIPSMSFPTALGLLRYLKETGEVVSSFEMVIMAAKA